MLKQETKVYGDLFWQEEAQKMFEVVFPIIESSVTTASLAAAEALEVSVGVGVNFELVNEAAVNYARSHSLELVKGITEKTKKVIQQGLSDHIQSGEPLSSLINDFIGKRDIGGMVGKVRAEMIAITETTRSFSEGNNIAWSASGEVDGYIFRTAFDDVVCPICGPLDGKAYDLSDNEHSPPIHPRCRCWKQPKLKVEG
jgi:SPP1 gp7 family putative phage head morphogenesis protein